MAFIYPDYNGNNVLNVAASLSAFLGRPNGNKTVPELDAELKKGYKRVLFLVFDALGTYPLALNTPADGYFRANTVKKLTTVFPSTTACASATMISGLYPSQHGRFGWCMNIPSLGGRVDILVGTKSENRYEKVDKEALKKMFPLRGFYLDNKTDYQVSSILSAIIDDGNENRIVEETVSGVFDRLYEICARPGKQFVYVHCPQPDNIFHHRGVDAEVSKQMVEDIQNRTKKLVEDLEDTLVIVTADHGQVNIKGYVPMYEDKVLTDMLSAPLHIEVRAVSLHVKAGLEEKFEKYFTEKYGKHFVLLKTEDLIEKGVFGPRTEKLNLLGNYFAVGTETHVMALLHPLSSVFAGQHTGLTEEMEVPLILLKSKKTDN